MHLHTKIEMDPIIIKRKSGGDTNPSLKMVNFVFRWPLVTLNMGRSENFKSMTHLLYIMHLHTKIEMDPIIIKQKSGGDTNHYTDGQTYVLERPCAWPSICNAVGFTAQRLFIWSLYYTLLLTLMRFIFLSGVHLSLLSGVQPAIVQWENYNTDYQIRNQAYVPHKEIMYLY